MAKFIEEEEEEEFSDDEGGEEEAFEEEDEEFVEEAPAQPQEQRHIFDLIRESMNPVKNAPPIQEALYTAGEISNDSAPGEEMLGSAQDDMSGSDKQKQIEDMRKMFYSGYLDKQINSAEYQKRVEDENNGRS